MSKQMNVLSGVLSGGTVSFHAIFAKAFRSIPVGVFLSQGYFWQENAKYRDKEKYKAVEGKTFFTMTAKEWFDETSLTQEQQTRVRETLVKHKVLIEWLTDNPAKLYFHIDLEALVSVINQYLVSGISVSVDNRNKNRFKTQTRLGKKPKQVSVINPTSYNEESNESLESEREGKNTHAPVENFDNLKEEKTEQGKVAPPPAEATAPALPPTHLVKSTVPGSPGMMEVEGMTLPSTPRVSTTIEAEKKISEWIVGDGIETVKFRYETAKERFDPAQATAIAAHYCSVYTKNPANKERLLKDPVTHFSDGLFSYIKSEQQYSRQRPQPGASPQQSPATVTISRPQSNTRY